MALAHKGRPVAGVVYAPALGKLYHGIQGGGAYLEDRERGRSGPLAVSGRTDGLIALASRSHEDDRVLALYETFRDVIREILPVGSSLKGCLIAEGAGDVYYRFNPIWQWDTAAMQCIVQEAGGTVAYLDGREIRYNCEETRHPMGFYVLNSRANLWL